ncbi:MAG: DUF3368 domain-containing protein [Deltaproteobacteria bacterium]|nr:DUF3368 domain-containing protein [Deltaproteobacteria bacterium]MBW1911284.1 DUF3368 domain-containing protein [Deltaproteobacteria bacterium]MBW2035771.1 DUF3368 domain-containing protein [Deltaproteobacteria bacterium]
MKIISDTGPIIGLAKIGKISLLKSIADEVLIPPMVHRELFAKVGTEADQIDWALNDFIRIEKAVTLDTVTERVLADLGEGEKQVIALASNLEKDIVLLLDDHAARGVAEKLNIPMIGLIGLLLISKEKGLVQNVVSLIEELRKKGYWLSEDVIEVARLLAGE